MKTINRSVATHFFSETYFDARDVFHESCKSLGSEPLSFELTEDCHPNATLTCDAAYFGDPSADTLFVVCCGTHGAESGCGSGVMSAWLQQRSFADRPANASVLLIHALNPWGHAQMARTDQYNIDLNRNFVDFGVEPPVNGNYADLHAWFEPQEWTPQSIEKICERMHAFKNERGTKAFLEALRAGQYNYPQGIGFGGFAPSWSRQTFETLLQKFAVQRRRVVFLDIHTGVGEYAEPVFICFHEPGSIARKRAAAWWSTEIDQLPSRNEQAIAYTGTIMQAVPEIIPDVETTAVCLEFGTLPMLDVQLAIVADNWLRRQDKKTEEQVSRAKALVQDAFFPADPVWRERVLDTALNILNRTLLEIAK
ncbi:MAG: DUF2817 domain-containing protein [Pseudomonadota bacterium]